MSRRLTSPGAVFWLCRIPALLVGLGIALIAVAADGPVIPRGKGDSCVADTDFMRRDHMRLLIHQRDETVLRGIRDEPFSLTECVDCHVQQSADGQAMRIDAEGQFCESCHTYAAVKIDCFGCHAAVPDKTAANSVRSLSPPFDPDKSHLVALASYFSANHHVQTKTIDTGK